MILFGNPVNPVIFGENPRLDIAMGTNANVPWKTDFRRVYHSILTDWFRAESPEASQILGGSFEHIQILKNSVGSDFIATGKDNGSLQVFPNPVDEKAILRFHSPGGKVRIKAVTLNGQSVTLYSSAHMPEGMQSVTIDRNGLAPGMYILSIETGSRVISGKITFR
jgi:hypothetical protein